MNNLTQTQQDTKQAYLDRQQAEMLMTNQNANKKRTERGNQSNRFIS